jgi:hypothetical protein
VGNTVSFRLRVANPGTVSGTANATLVGMRDHTQIYSQAISVTASPGSEIKTFSFPPYKATATGVITWTVTIIDQTPDKATASTTVYKGYTHEHEEEERE